MGGVRRGGRVPDRRLSEQAKQQLRDGRARFCSFAAGGAPGGSCRRKIRSPARALARSGRSGQAMRQRRDARGRFCSADLGAPEYGQDPTPASTKTGGSGAGGEKKCSHACVWSKRVKYASRDIKVTIDLVTSSSEQSLSQESGILSPNKKKKMEATVAGDCSRRKMTGKEISFVKTRCTTARASETIIRPEMSKMCADKSATDNDYSNYAEDYETVEVGRNKNTIDLVTSDSDHSVRKNAPSIEKKRKMESKSSMFVKENNKAKKAREIEPRELSILELHDAVAASQAEIKLLEDDLRKEKEKKKRLQEALNAGMKKTRKNV